jgi:predicted lipid-binding transport protein (Tim44 family)
VLSRLRAGLGLRRWLEQRRPSGRARTTRPGRPYGSAPAAPARHARDDAALAGLLDSACQSFVSVQRAWDAADLERLATLTTQPLWQDLRAQLELRGPQECPTEVLEVQASLAGLERVGGAHVARIEFRGMILERPGGAPAPFRELWLVACTADDDRWRLAHVQALI